MNVALPAAALKGTGSLAMTRYLFFIYAIKNYSSQTTVLVLLLCKFVIYSLSSLFIFYNNGFYIYVLIFCSCVDILTCVYKYRII